MTNDFAERAAQGTLTITEEIAWRRQVWAKYEEAKQLFREAGKANREYREYLLVKSNTLVGGHDEVGR
jgi:hypothetical protein